MLADYQSSVKHIGVLEAATPWPRSTSKSASYVLGLECQFLDVCIYRPNLKFLINFCDTNND